MWQVCIRSTCLNAMISHNTSIWDANVNTIMGKHSGDQKDYLNFKYYGTKSLLIVLKISFSLLVVVYHRQSGCLSNSVQFFALNF